MAAIRVFISYSHDSQEHLDRVWDLSDQLRLDGIECCIDQHEQAPQRGWPGWCKDQIETADFVLVLCTENYKFRYDGKVPRGTGRGTQWEGYIIEQEIYDAGSTKFVPVLFSEGDVAHLPVELRRCHHYVVNPDKEALSTDSGYIQLLRRLTGRPERVPRVVSEKPRLLPIQGVQDSSSDSSADLPSLPTLPRKQSGHTPRIKHTREAKIGSLNLASKTGTTRQTASQQKAVIFTHFGELHYGKKAGIPRRLRDFQADDAEWLRNTPRHLAKYTEIFQSYLECARDSGQVGLVYVYVDWAIREAAPTWAKGRLVFDPAFVGHDQALLGLLENAERNARDELRVGGDAPPQFRCFGMVKLVNLLNNLVEVDRHLLAFLGGPGGTPFTYDSPKFAEAVIRLARSDIQHLADPVLRIDEDAKPTPGFIRRLVQEYAKISRAAPFFFFSGTYGNPNGPYDPINDHAVRTHWLATVPQEPPVKLTEPQTELARIFLADLSVLGATQLRDCCSHHSHAMRDLLSGHPPNGGPQVSIAGHPPKRGPQVISGAGLMMSPRAVNFFPPFMNLENLVVWVDDHLKRRLHEAAGDISPQEPPESVEGARIQQDRHPNGLTQERIDWAKTVYFDRLLRGCMFTRLIADLHGEPTEYAQLLKDIAWVRVRKGDLRVSEKKLECLRRGLVKPAEERYDQVVQCWQSSEFRETVIYDWVASLGPQHRTDSREKVTHDAISYVHLLLEWPIFKHAIARLKMNANPWLFCETR